MELSITTNQKKKKKQTNKQNKTKQSAAYESWQKSITEKEVGSNV